MSPAAPPRLDRSSWFDLRQTTVLTDTILPRRFTVHERLEYHDFSLQLITRFSEPESPREALPYALPRGNDCLRNAIGEGITASRMRPVPSPWATRPSWASTSQALERLKARAEAEGSDAVVVVKDGRLIADWDFGKKRGPIEAMSATKSVVSLAIGRLIDQGKIKSLDQPVSDFFPEWKQGRKRLITVRHLLNHTSGLEDKPTSQEIYASPDYIQFALAADVASDPGSRFFYSNKATNLLAGVVLRASGMPLDEYVKREIFAPLDHHRFRVVERPLPAIRARWPDFRSPPSTSPRSASSCSTKASGTAAGS